MDETAQDELSIRAARIIVVLAGASVSAIAAAGAWWLGVPWVAAILAGGAVAGPLAAVRRSRRLTGPGWLGAALASGIEAPFVAAGVILVLVVGAAPFSGGDLGGGLVRIAFGALFVGLYAAIFGLPASVPVAIVAGFLVRRAARLGPRAARRHVALLAGAAAVVGLVTLADVTGLRAAVAPGIAPIDWAEESAAVRLDLTIENRTTEQPNLEVGWHEPDGSSAWMTGAPSCSRVRWPPRIRTESGAPARPRSPGRSRPAALTRPAGLRSQGGTSHPPSAPFVAPGRRQRDDWPARRGKRRGAQR